MPHVESLEQPDRRRRRHRQQAMRGFYRSIAQRNLRVVNPLDTELLDTPYRADDIENRVDRSDFVEMQVVGGDAVYGALDCRNRFKRGMRRAGNLVRNLYGIDQSVYFRNRSAVRLLRNVSGDNLIPSGLV